MIDTSRSQRLAIRRGISLVETLVVMMMMTVLMGIGVTAIIQLHRLLEAGRADLERVSTLGRFADDLRRDLHDAETIETSTDPNANRSDQLVLRFRDRPSITYLHDEDGVRRSVDALDSPQPRIERYLLSDEFDGFEIGIVPVGDRVLVRFTVRFRELKPGRRESRRVIEAIRGL